MRPPHERRLYAIVFAIVLQCFPCASHPGTGWTRRSQATVPLPPAPRGSRPAQAAPRGSSRSPALPTGRVRHAHAPVRAPAARHVPILSQTVLHGMPVVDPTACQPPGAPDLSTTPVGAGLRPRASVSACPRVRCRHHASVQGYAAGVPAYLLEQGVRTYGRRPAYLRETGVRTYGRLGCVPTGDAPRTYGRLFSL
jgi:hypothetical protein